MVLSSGIIYFTAIVENLPTVPFTSPTLLKANRPERTKEKKSKL